MYLENGRVRKFRRSSEDPGCAHELTFSCYRRLPLLNRDRTRGRFIESLTAARNAHNFSIWAYVVMPEHVHLLIVPNDDSYRIRSILQSIKQLVATKAIGFIRRTGSTNWTEKLTVPTTGKLHFRQPGGGYDRNVNKGKTAANMIRYMHENPVRRGLVSVATDWKWSSARWYAGEEDAVLSIDAGRI